MDLGFDPTAGDASSWAGPELNLDFDVSSQTSIINESEYEPSVGHGAPSSAVGTELARGLKRYNTEVALDTAWVALNNKQPKQCWETGFWGNIFSENAMSFQSPVFSAPSFDRPAYVHDPVMEVVQDLDKPASSKQSKVVKPLSYMDVVSKSSVQSWQEQRDEMWETAMRRWHSCIMHWKGDDLIIKTIQGKESFREQCQIIVDVMRNKSPATLLKRCNSVSRLVNWLSFPCTENELYDHLCAQRNLNVPVSRMKSLLEAVAFTRFVLGVESLDDCVKSRRCTGVASCNGPSIVKQAPAMTVEHVAILHHVIETDEDPWNRALCGMALFCIYSRARWSDAQHSQFIHWDVNSDGHIAYVECSTAVHKTCKSLNLRHCFLPLTAPASGVTGNDWASSWKTAREMLGIEDLSQFPLMPAPGESGEALVRPLSTSEAGGWINMIIQHRSSVEISVKYTSHSLKATCLSYLAKFGASFEDRLALGYHVDQIRMALRYSRDGASRPLRILEQCLQAIRDGRFRPDETRSGRFVEASERSDLDASLVSQDSFIKVEDVDLGSDQSDCLELKADNAVEQSEPIVIESDHATTCSESESDDGAVVLPKVSTRIVLIPSGATLWKHNKLKTFHLCLEGYSRVFACGRSNSQAYTRSDAEQRFDMIKCKQCFKSSLIRGNNP